MSNISPSVDKVTGVSNENSKDEEDLHISYDSSIILSDHSSDEDGDHSTILEKTPSENINLSIEEFEDDVMDCSLILEDDETAELCRRLALEVLKEFPSLGSSTVKMEEPSSCSAKMGCNPSKETTESDGGCNTHNMEIREEYGDRGIGDRTLLDVDMLSVINTGDNHLNSDHLRHDAHLISVPNPQDVDIISAASPQNMDLESASTPQNVDMHSMNSQSNMDLFSDRSPPNLDILTVSSVLNVDIIPILRPQNILSTMSSHNLDLLSVPSQLDMDMLSMPNPPNVEFPSETNLPIVSQISKLSQDTGVSCDQLVSKDTSRSFPEEEYDEDIQIEIDCNTEDEFSTTSSDSDDVEVFEVTDAGSGESWVRI